MGYKEKAIALRLPLGFSGRALDEKETTGAMDNGGDRTPFGEALAGMLDEREWSIAQLGREMSAKNYPKRQPRQAVLNAMNHGTGLTYQLVDWICVGLDASQHEEDYLVFKARETKRLFPAGKYD